MCRRCVAPAGRGRCYPCAASAPVRADGVDHGGSMRGLGEFLDGIGTVDLLIFLFFIGFFILGYAQGTIRRLLGIARSSSRSCSPPWPSRSASSSGDNWTQFPRAYSYMVGFGTGLRWPRPSRWRSSSRATTSRSRCSRRPASPTRSSAACSACSRRRSSSAPSCSSSTRTSGSPGSAGSRSELPVPARLLGLRSTASQVAAALPQHPDPGASRSLGLFVPETASSSLYPLR